MSVSSEQLKRAKDAGTKREQQGYFGRVKAGDQKAASLFARLVAYDLNPNGSASDYGWLTKAHGEQQVDGWAEDAIVFGADQSDLQNVVDLVRGGGAPNAAVIAEPKERRPWNLWAAPHALSADEMSYLLSGGQPQPPQPPAHEPYPGDAVFDDVGTMLFSDYAQAGQAPNPQMGRWFGRTIYDWLAKNEPSLSASIVKHRKEWRAILGLPPL